MGHSQRKESMQRNRLLIAGLLALPGLWAHQPSQAQDARKAGAAAPAGLVPFHAPTLGPADAKVTIVEFFDPSCEACRAFFPYVKSIMAEHPTKVRLVLRYAAFHRNSDVVVKKLEAARRQGLYWQALEAVLRDQPAWADHRTPQVERVWESLRSAGVDIDRARRDMQDPGFASLLKLDMADGVRLQVERTPTFYVNGRLLETGHPDALRALVRDEVRARYP